MFFTSVEQAVQIEQSKLLGHTGTFPQDYPYVGAAIAAITRGDLGGGALHLSSLARLNADLNRLRNTMPSTFDHFVKRWRDLVQGFPESAKDNAPLIRGWRVEVLTAAQLASTEVPFEIGDYNPRAVQGQPDLIAHFAGTRLSIECGSVEPQPGSDLADRVRNAVWNKAYDARTRRLREYVGPNALLVLDITSVAARHAAESGGTANLDAFTRSVARALSKRAHRHGTDWGAVVLHFIGIHAEQEDPAVASLELEQPSWAVSMRGSNVVLSRTDESRRLVNRSFFTMIGYKPSAALDGVIAKCFPMAKDRFVAELEHLPWTVMY